MQTKPDAELMGSPYPIWKTDHTGNAPVVANYVDAETTLKNVQLSRANLESNLDIILRGKNDIDIYDFIDQLSQDG